MMIRMRYEAVGGHVRVTVFTGQTAADCGQSGILMIRLGDWPAFRERMEHAMIAMLPAGKGRFDEGAGA